MSGVLKVIFPTYYGSAPQLDAMSTDSIAGLVGREYRGLLVPNAVWLVHLVLSFVRQRVDTRVFMGLCAQIASHVVGAPLEQVRGTSAVSALARHALRRRVVDVGAIERARLKDVQRRL